jgi:hypothetical protein
VREYITIGMSDGTFVERDLDPTYHQLAASGEAMQIVSDS